MSAILAGGIKGNFPLFAGHKNPPARQKHAQARTGDATAANGRNQTTIKQSVKV